LRNRRSLIVNARLTQVKKPFLFSFSCIFEVMKTTIKILIIASVIAIVILSIIQYYLISNTFQLQKDAYVKKVKKELRFIEINERKDDWDEAYLAKTQKLIKQYKKGIFSKEQLITQFSQFNDSINKDFMDYFNQKIQKSELKSPVKYQEKITSVVLLGNIMNDTIVSPKSDGFLLFGEVLNPKTKFGFNSGKWNSESISRKDGDSLLVTEEKIHLEIKSMSYIDIPEWRTAVLQEMIGILSLSILSILTVIGLFIYALSSFIKQKKITDVKTDFINNIAHELKTPLATLSIATKTIQEEKSVKDNAIVLSTVNTIDRQRVRLQNIVDQVINNSLGINEIVLDKTNVSSKLFLQNLINDYKLSKSSILVTACFNKLDTQLYIDKFHIATAILNVLDNAVKYGSNKLKVSTKTLDNYFKITIEDDGIGVAKEHRQKVFEKFYRVENTNVHDVKGLGLGLFYVHQIIKAHGGTVDLHSAKGKGTTIIINIPI